MKKWLIACVCAALLLQPRASNAATPFEIGVVISLTGAGAYIGKQQNEALGLLENYVNRNGVSRVLRCTSPFPTISRIRPSRCNC